MSLSAVEHRKSLGELLGRLVGCGQVEADVWRMYAHFHFSSTDTIDLVKVRERGEGLVYICTYVYVGSSRA